MGPLIIPVIVEKALETALTMAVVYAFDQFMEWVWDDSTDTSTPQTTILDPVLDNPTDAILAGGTDALLEHLVRVQVGFAKAQGLNPIYFDKFDQALLADTTIEEVAP